MSNKIRGWETYSATVGTRFMPLSKRQFAFKDTDPAGWLITIGDLLGLDLLMLDDNLVMPDGGRLDVLGIGLDREPALLQIKRAIVTCDLLIRTLYYSSWILTNISKNKIAHPFTGISADKVPRVIVVTSGIGEGVEQLVARLNAAGDADVTLVCLGQAALADGPRFVFRSVVRKEDAAQKDRSTERDLLRAVAQRKTGKLLEILREAAPWFREEPLATSSGLLRLWAERPAGGGAIAYAIDVFASLAATPIGALDVYVRTARLAELAATAPADIQSRLRRCAVQIPTNGKDFAVRVSNAQQATDVLNVLKSVFALKAKVMHA